MAARHVACVTTATCHAGQALFTAGKCPVAQAVAGRDDRRWLSTHLRVHCLPPAPTPCALPVGTSVTRPTPVLRQRRWLLRCCGCRGGLSRGGPLRLSVAVRSRSRRFHCRQPGLGFEARERMLSVMRIQFHREPSTIIASDGQETFQGLPMGIGHCRLMLVRGDQHMGLRGLRLVASGPGIRVRVEDRVGCGRVRA